MLVASERVKELNKDKRWAVDVDVKELFVPAWFTIVK